MIAIPAVLFYAMFAAFAVFAVLGAVALAFAIAIMVSVYKLVRLAQSGVDEAREKFNYVQELFLLVTGL